MEEGAPRDSFQVHGTTVAVGGLGVLLRGPSGSGKSDLALRLIDGGARLVADDRTVLRRIGERLKASAPATIRGLMEVRGLGIVTMDPAGEVPLALVADLVPPDAVPRMPRPCDAGDLPVRVPRIVISPFEASAPAKVRAALAGLAAGAGPRDATGGSLRGAARETP